jgi:hypothetical protein
MELFILFISEQIFWNNSVFWIKQQVKKKEKFRQNLKGILIWLDFSGCHTRV